MRYINQAKFLLLFILIAGSMNLFAQYPAGSPVAINGKLKLVGNKLSNECGNPVQLRGMSSHGLQWYSNCVTTSSLDALVNNWGIDIFRLAMYVQEGGYTNNPSQWKTYIDTWVDACAARGIYCLIDWHVLNPGDPNANVTESKDFWSYMATKHGSKKHVLFEICNEPNGVSWSTVKTYANQVIPVIRAIDANTIIIVGTPNWSQDVDIAAADPLTYSNIMYTLHFYSGSHSQALRDKGNTAMSKGAALFVTECGTSDASGNNGPFTPEFTNWITWMAANNISWCNWSFSDKNETSAALNSGSCSGNNWTSLTTSGTYIKDKISNPADNFVCSSTPSTVTVSITSPTGGTNFAEGSNITISANATTTNGTISKVEFYQGTTLIGTANSSPYSITWNNVAPGSYGITAKATNAASETATSSSISINVIKAIVQTSSAPTIDGSVDAVWSAPTAANLGTTLVGSGFTSTDLSANWKAMWDATNLYVLVTVTDDAKVNNSDANTYDDDEVEVYIDINNNKATTYGANDFQYTFRWNDATLVREKNNKTTGVVRATTNTATGYITEISIPWSTLTGTPAINQLVGFDVMVNDDDNGGTRDGKISWNAGADNAYQNPSLFGTTILTGSTCTTPPTTSNAGTDQNVCGLTSTTLAGNTPTTGTGAWSIVSGTATITNTASATSAVTGLSANGTATLRWTISNGSCTPSTDDVVITTASAPTTANAGADQNICGGTTTTLAGNTAASGTGAWSVVSGTATITSTASNTSNVTGLAANGTATLRWTISKGACTASTDDVIITTASAPTTANAGADQNICGLTSTTLAGNTAASGTGAWSVVSGTATITSTASNTSNVTGLAANGTATLRWTISKGACSASTDDVIITTASAPTTANAGADQNICGLTSTTLAGNTAASGTGAWSVVSGTATITSTASNTSAVTGLSANGTATLRWTISKGSCTASTDDVIITTASAPTTANAGADQNICGLTSTTLAGNTAASGTGAWSVVSGTATITSTASNTSAVTGLSANGTATLRWTISKGSCTASTDDVIITTASAPTTANAGADQNICGLTSTTLAGNTAASGTGAWSVVSGTATITSTASNTSNVTGLAANGTATLRWTISKGSCTASTDDVIITTASAPTTANAGADQNICGGTTTTLAGNTAASGTGAWSVVSGTATITSTASNTSNVTGLAANGTATLRWTISKGSCTASTDDVIITTASAPTTANAGADQNICGGTTTTLAGNTAASGTGAWSVVSGTATITSTVSNTSNVTGLAANGTATLRWTISNGSCTPSTDDVVITTASAPTTANAGADQNICGGTTTTLAGNTAASGTGAWSVVSGTATITSTASNTSNVTGLAANGTATLRWTISKGSCTASTDDVIITTASAPTTANAGADQNICNTNAALAANTPSSGTGSWTIVSGSASFTNVNSSTTTVNGLGNGTNILKWTVTNGSCSASSDNVTITVSGAPTSANAGADQSICITTTALAGNSPTIGTGAWSIVSGSATIANPASGTSTISGLNIGSVTLRWTIGNGACTSSDDVIITKAASSPTANAGTDKNITSSTTTLAGNTASPATGTWTVVSGTATFVSANSPTTSVSGLANGANTLRWSISGTCGSSTDDVIITVGSIPVTSTITGPTNVTTNQTGVAYSVTNHPGSTYAWTVPTGATIITNNGSNIVVDFGTSGGNVSVTETNNFGTGSTVSKTISVGSAPATSSITGPSSVTPNQTGVVYSVTNNPGSTYSWIVPTGATIIGNATGNSIVVDFGTSSGNVSVVETNNFGSGSSVSKTVSMPSGVQGANAIGEAKVYPNPFQEEAIINIQSSTILPLTLKISDLNGKELMTLDNHFTNEDINVGKELSQGVYLIQATQGDKIQVIRLVKMK